MDLSTGQRRQAFSAWLRTGRWPRPAERRALEVKFNPWHDPSNGRFTYAGGGSYAGAGGGARPAGQDSGAKPAGRGGGQNRPPLRFEENSTLPPIKNRADADAWWRQERAKHAGNPAELSAVDAWHKHYLDKLTAQSDAPGNPVVEFAEGFGEGVYDVGKGTIQGLYALVTTNPVTTARNIGRGVAGTIDAAIAAEDTPAYVQIDRAAGALANASAHDIGHGIGTVVANVGLAVAPGAAAAKVSAVVRARASAAAATAAADALSNVWRMGPGPRGEALERVFGHNLPRNFPVVDKLVNKVVTSIKSINLEDPYYLQANNLRRVLKRHVDKVSEYVGTRPRGWAGVTIPQDAIKARVLEIIIPNSMTAAQRKIFKDIVKYGASRSHPVKVRIRRFDRAVKK